MHRCYSCEIFLNKQGVSRTHEGVGGRLGRNIIKGCGVLPPWSILTIAATHCVIHRHPPGCNGLQWDSARGGAENRLGVGGSGMTPRHIEGGTCTSIIGAELVAGAGRR